MKNTWLDIAPAKPFDYYFLDEDFDQQYRDEERWTRIVTYATMLAIAIGCVGLLGLSALAVTKRTKEIGIRKTLGASVPSIMQLLTKEFLVLLALANVIAWPVAWYTMNRWLQNFAYHVDINLAVFVLAGGLVVLIALLTVGTQTIKAALANPVETLRYE